MRLWVGLKLAAYLGWTPLRILQTFHDAPQTALLGNLDFGFDFSIALEGSNPQCNASQPLEAALI